jgi:hypothetical protein
MKRTLPLPLLAIVALGACADAPTANPTALSLTALAKKDGPSLASGVTVVMSQLDNPRGLTWGPEGALYVAEAGNGTITGPCAPVPRGQNCYSGTGAITRLWKGEQERVASGLPSIILMTAAGPGDVAGPHDVSFQGKGNGYVTIGWGGPPAARAALGALGGTVGALIRVTPNGGWKVVADIAGFENANNPAGGPLDSNPYGVLAEGGQTFVTDAGGNSILAVSANGDVSLVGVLPPTAASGADAVPTEVVRGPDGALYVSQLTGVPFLAGAASIWRIAQGSAPQIYKTGFKTITDTDWGPDGSLYVLQYATGAFFAGPGLVIRIAPDGTQTTIATGLTNPTSVLAGDDGVVYVSNRGNVAGTGEVLRIVP